MYTAFALIVLCEKEEDIENNILRCEGFLLLGYL